MSCTEKATTSSNSQTNRIFQYFSNRTSAIFDSCLLMLLTRFWLFLLWEHSELVFCLTGALRACCWFVSSDCLPSHPTRPSPAARPPAKAKVNQNQTKPTLPKPSWPEWTMTILTGWPGLAIALRRKSFCIWRSSAACSRVLSRFLMFTCICVGTFDRVSSYLIPPHPILVVGGKTRNKVRSSGVIMTVMVIMMLLMIVTKIASMTPVKCW